MKRHYFLVVRGKDTDIWSLPKGRMHDENSGSIEDEHECAERETFEETGLKINTRCLPKITIGKNVYFVKHVDKSDYQRFDIQDVHEVGEVAWKTISELKSMKCNKDLRAVLSFPRNNQHYYNIVYKNRF